jgi:hypothetical protein
VLLNFPQGDVGNPFWHNRQNGKGIFVACRHPERSGVEPSLKRSVIDAPTTGGNSQSVKTDCCDE